MSYNFHAGDRALWFGFVVEVLSLLPSKHLAYIQCSKNEHWWKCDHYVDLDELLPVPKEASENQIQALKILTEKPRL